MLEFFSIFGVLCFYTSHQSDNIECMNFWEDPVIKYEKIQTCLNKAKSISIEIESNFRKKGLTISKMELYCLPIDKSNQKGKIIS